MEKPDFDLVTALIADYATKYDHFEQVARRCAQECEQSLEEEGIRAIVTSRAKRSDRLRDKARRIVEEDGVASLEALYGHRKLRDLAGARIALYFPSDADRVDAIIRKTFDLVDEKSDFPQQPPTSFKPRFAGYKAHHYFVRMRPSTFDARHKQHSATIIEIQIATLLMHSWSEVEHDIVYKPFSGEVSASERAILDQLRGLVEVGESLLEQLQESVNHRIVSGDLPFKNQYELTSFVVESLKNELSDNDLQVLVGRSDVLLAFLREASFDRPGALAKLIANSYSPGDTSLDDQIVDAILAEHPELREAYVRLGLDAQNPDHGLGGSSIMDYERAVGFFLSRWTILETLLSDLQLGRVTSTTQSRRVHVPMFSTSALAGLIPDQRLREKILHVRHVRNEVVHGRPGVRGTSQLYVGAADEIAEILEELRAHVTQYDQALVDVALSQVQRSSH